MAGAMNMLKDPCMTDSLDGVLVPYARFLECRDRRARIAVELTQPDEPPTIDAEVLPKAVETAVAQPLTGSNAER
jgi:hypothetical protein